MCTSTKRPNSSTISRALARVSAYGEIAETITAPPWRVIRDATQPTRSMFVSRSSLEKPRPFERCWRTASPSRYSTIRPRFSSSGPTISAIVVLPAPDRPVNHSVKPSGMCLLQGRVFVDPALELVGAGPAACALLFVLRDRPGAGNAADGAIPRLVQRVVGNLVHLDVRPDALLVPVRERVHFPDVVALRPLELRRLRAARRLVAADARDPGAVGAEGGEQGLALGDLTAGVGVALQEIGAFPPVLLCHRDDRVRDQVQAVPLHEPVARLVRLAEEELGVELDDGKVEAELGDHVHEHGRLLLPGARKAELVSVLAVDPREQLFCRHGFVVGLRKRRSVTHRCEPSSKEEARG